ncbi:hypothetical protein [Paenibacillus sophorae]|nr:hypothetical protein [Paenibacillus sophorae]QWU14307.1 hypothetical protein KP014_20585 [Paenibacillus sophorae]
MKEVNFKVEEDVYWDNNGERFKAFDTGDIVTGIVFYRENAVVDYLWAESTNIKGIEDVVPLSSIDIIK